MNNESSKRQAPGALYGAMIVVAVSGASCVGDRDDVGLDHTALATALVQSSAAACPTPRSRGAIPDDGIDDRAALQAALTSGCSPLVLEAGTYNIATPPVPRPAAMLVMPSNMEIVGAGPTTILAFAGNAGGRDWRGIQLGNRAVIHHVKLDTAGLVNTNEQTHAIRGDGPLASPLVEHVTFHHPYRGFDGGDCLQLVGYPETRIIDPIIRDNDFAVCDRSGVAFHSGVHGGQISNNKFSNTGDQDLDGEGSGDIDGLEIGPGNTFTIGSNPGSVAALHLQLATNMRIHDNTFQGRGLFIYGCSGCEFDHNSITLTMLSSYAPLEIEKASHGVYIHDETIVRAASAGVGSTIRVVPHGSGTPSDVTIANNQLTQHSDGTMVVAYGVVGLHIVGNNLTYDGTLNKSYALSALGSAGDQPIRTTGIEITSNTITGPVLAAVHLSGSYGGAGTASIAGNTSVGATRGLWCENITSAGQILGPITYGANAMPAPQCGALVP